ncbi:HK97 gp10 family phage protein [Brevibacillus sp. NRS-1366]|uniref:HK97 gp10 family phage protein n=1 Tax=Brevibacillus sp. NRS-1366 TaxID=3233899 RepID=UPI003D2245D5
MAKVNKKDLERQYKRLNKQSKREVQVSMDRVARAAGLQVLRGAQDRVPSRDGLLRASLMLGHKENVFDFVLNGLRAEITIGTSLSYARYVEEGFTQRKGQFVPGYWDKEKFIYVPDHPGGMILKGKRIPGVHYLARSEAEVESIMDELVKEELDDLARRLFPDGR